MIANHFLLNGIKIPFNENIISSKIKAAIEKGTYENEEYSQLKKLVQPGEKILEIGAGLGYISTFIRKTFDVDSIMCYEANPNLIPFIENVHKLNNAENITVINKILTNSLSDHQFKFYLRENFWGSSLEAIPAQYVEVIDIGSSYFPEVIAKFKPSLIICDIEGGEYELFKNSNLEGVEKIMLEIHQAVLGRNKIRELFNFMSARFFHYDQHHSSGSVVTFSHINRGKLRNNRLQLHQN